MDEGAQARQAGNFAAAERAIAEALLATEADSNMVVERAMAFARQGAVHQDLQRPREAERAYLHAHMLLQREVRTPRIAQMLGSLCISLAALYIEQEQPSKAKRLDLARVLPDLAEPREVANAQSVLASIAFAEGRHVEAESAWMRALAVLEGAQCHEDAAVVLSNLGVLATRRGDFARAARLLERSLDHFRAELGLDHLITLKSQANLGQVLYRLGRHKEAADWLGRAHNLGLRWLGDQDPLSVQLSVAYAEALRKSGHKEEAKLLIDRVRRLPAAVRAAVPGQNTIDIVGLAARPRD